MTFSDGSILDLRSTATSEGVVIVAIAGEIDLSSSPHLRAELVRALKGGASRILIDAAGIDFIDSGGISALIMAHQALTKRGGGLEIHNAPRAIRRMLDVSGVDQHIAVRPLGEPTESGAA